MSHMFYFFILAFINCIRDCLLVAKAVCHNGAGFTHFEPIVKENDIFGQYDLMENCKSSKKSKLHFLEGALLKKKLDFPQFKAICFPVKESKDISLKCDRLESGSPTFAVSDHP